MKSSNQLGIPVLFDPTGTALSNVNLDNRHYHFVMERGAQITHKRQFNDSTWEGAVDTILGL